MADEDLFSTYGDLVDETDDPAMFATIRTLEQAYPRVQPPPSLLDRVRKTATAAPLTSAPTWRRLVCPLSVRRSVTTSAVLALAITVLGGAGYAMHILGGPFRAHVVLSCSRFGARWQLTGVGARMMPPQQFADTGGRLIPEWHRQVSRLQHPRYWVTPANADIVDTCRGSSSSQVEIGANQQAHTQLVAISVVPMWESSQPVLVGSLRIPAVGGCVPKPTTLPIKGPNGRSVAQLAHVPATLSRSIRATFPPCQVSKRPVRTPQGLPPVSHQIAFHVLSQVEYQGRAGTVVVLSARPSRTALRLGLRLGNPTGTLPDGTRLWTWTQDDVRWMKGGLIISVSGDVSLARLKDLAADVVVR